MTDEESEKLERKRKLALEVSNRTMQFIRTLHDEHADLTSYEVCWGLIGLTKAICDKLEWDANKLWSIIDVPEYEERVDN